MYSSKKFLLIFLEEYILISWYIFYEVFMSDLKSFLKTTPLYIKLLANNGINTVKDFFNYFPRAYENRADIKPLNQLVFDEKWITSTKGKIIKKTVFRRWAKTIYEISFEDELWNMWYISIFNSWYLASKIQEWFWYIIVWKPTFKYNKIIFSHPDLVPSSEWWDLQELYNSGRIFPIYSEMNWIKPWWFARKIWEHRNDIPYYFSEYLPKEFLEHFKLLDVQNTILNIHYPDNERLKNAAIHRVFFDRLLRIQIFSLMNKMNYQSTHKVMDSSQQWDILKEMLWHLPFELTIAQKKVVKQIIDDFHSWRPMLRLLQGDVGSWKTIVATLAAFYLKKVSWWQTAFLAPLEVLAQQHYQSIAKLLLPLWMRVELITWSLTKSQKDKIKMDLEQGKIDVIIWTHALLQEGINFKNLQYVIIDEQHKFWVKQRAFFKKFWAPHILQMSATPIPRSMAIAFFWEFDVSIIDELPKGRLPIKTKIITNSEVQKLKPWIIDRINKGEKLFVVTPLIEESETLDDVQSVLTEYENMQSLFPELKWKIGLLHWKMKPKDKEEVMKNFKNWKYVILVSTTVIEVWVDVPEATVMIIRNSERFWLAQLHQLRGRIGRSDIQSYCFLETPKKSWESYERLKAMEQTTDWFKLAELDLQNRWSWEILWTMQSGMSDIPIDVLSDMKFLETVQEWAKWLLERYPNLEGFPSLQGFLDEKMGDILA